MKTDAISTLAVQISSTSYQTCKCLRSNQSKNASIRDGDIPGRVERQLSSETCLARSLNGLIFSSRLEMLLFSMIPSMLHFPGLASDFFCRFVASQHRKKSRLRYIDCSERLFKICLC